jgi:hypothetical protein
MTQLLGGLRKPELDTSSEAPFKEAMAIIRVSREDQLRGYGPDAQWQDDVLPNAPFLGLRVEEGYRRIIQEPATGWNRPKFEEAVREAIRLHQSAEVAALLFPRVDRETRFLFALFPHPL